MDILERLKALLGDAGVISSPAQMAPYLEDERGLYQGRAACIAFPRTTDEVAGIVKLCAKTGAAVVPQGGNTGYCGGATPMADREVLVNLSRMSGIRAIDPLGMTVTVEAGVILADLQAAAAEAGLLFPLSMGSEGSCQIGGNLSTNAGGLAVLKYGTARELVLGIEVVLASGEILDLLKPLRKDNTGYHLEQLFLGAEGTLGIITAATLKLFPAPTEQQTAWLAVASTEAACRLLPLARGISGDTVTSFEYVSGPSLALVLAQLSDARAPFQESYPHHVLLELSAPLPPGTLRERLETLLTEALDSELAQDAVIAESDGQRQQLWKLRESIPEAENRAGGSIKHDISVAIDQLSEYLTLAPQRMGNFPGARASIYGHLGDGNLHYNVIAPAGEDAGSYRKAHGDAISASLHDLAAEMGGSFSAEHGVGQLKRNQLAHYANPVALSIMKTLKRSLDPEGIFNPGKVL